MIVPKIALLDVSVILLRSIIEIAIAAVDDLPAERPADRAGVGIMPVRGHPVRGVAHHSTGRPEEAAGFRWVVVA